jgi:type II secretory ATPase GspE/PulE/Tfp pilus assembly ATPase PilB-like protein
MDDKSKKDLQEELEKLRRDGEERAAQRLAADLKYQYFDIRNIPVSLDALKIIPKEDAYNAKIGAIQIKDKKIAVVVTDPNLDATKRELENLKSKGYEVKVVIVSLSGLKSVLDYYKFIKKSEEDITGKISVTEERFNSLIKSFIKIEDVNNELKKLNIPKTSPTIILEILFAGAIALRSSDIHMEAEENGAKFRFRIDGLLHDIFNNYPPVQYENLLSHIKLLSGMKLNVHSEAQDGRFSMKLGVKEIEMRVSILPAEFGETVVMRILDPSATMVGLPQLGLRDDDLEIVKRQLAKPNGLILNTGPTGSGKTTTLYAFLRTMNNPEEKIITLEDPIEYKIEGIEQTQVNDETGYTFANGLRAIVRQDPDIILVGEIRDLETADIALQASLTGHLVLSTLHTNDAIGAVPRLINLGVKAVSIGPALSLVIAQRLVRVLCPYCKKPVEVDENMKENIRKFLDRMPEKIQKQKYENYTIYEPVGCEKCNMMGYKGRIGAFEFLEGGEDIETSILTDASEVSLRKIAKKQNMVKMQEDGILKVLLGITTFDEVEDATGIIDWTQYNL